MSGYRDLREICRGSDLTLYRAVDARGRPVVIKTLAPALAAGASERAGTALRREYQLLSDLDDPGVVRAIALDEVEGQPALILEDVGPRVLAASMAGKPADVGRFFDVAIPLAEILARLHGKNVIHRNVSPANVVLGPSDRVTLVDFASATKVPSLAETVAPGTLGGTSPYASPEQTGRTSRPVDHRSDLYSLGATFYTLLTGGPPFQSADPLEIMHWHLARAPTPPSVANPEIPELLSALVLKLLAKMPEHRYQSAEAVAADLREAQQRWSSTHAIEKFALGSLDLARELAFPPQLYGRARELAVLRAVVERVAAGAAEVVIVSGVAGIGKTALVDEVRASIADHGGLFAAGKFGLPLGREPYAAISAALRGAVHEIVASSPQRWRPRLVAALGADGCATLRDMIPELAQLVEAPASPPHLDPVEAEARYHLAIRGLIRALASPSQPLALFLDDLQWADEATMRFLWKLPFDETWRNILFVACCRVEDLDAPAPVRRVIDTLRRANVVVTEIVLEPLDIDAIASFCAETFRTDPTSVRGFAELVARKTAGNPFFVRALLRSLQRDGLVSFDADAKVWTWDLARLEQVVITDNVVDLMIATIQQLSRPARELLEIAACVGNRVPLDLVAAVSGRGREAAANHLDEAVHRGLLVFAVEASAETGSVYRFVHDRVHQAVYSLLPGDRRTSLHWEIGLRLLERRPAAGHERWLFETVDQLDLGATTLDEARRSQLADLNCRAGRKARAAVAFASALAYLRRAIELLPEDEWGRRRELALALHREAAECAYLSGDYAMSEMFVERALPHATSILERAALMNVRITAATMRGAYDEALRIGIEELRRFGIEIPTDLQPEIIAEQAAIDALLHGRDPSDLAEAAPIQNAEDVACAELFARMQPAAIFARWELSTYLSLRAVRLIIERGRSPHAPSAYTSYARILLRSGDYERADAFGRLALQLVRETASRAQECKVLLWIAAFVSPWRAPLSASIPLLERSIDAGLAAGELQHVAYGFVSRVTTLLALGTDLNVVLEACNEALAFCVRTDLRIPFELVRVTRQAARCLKGYTARRGSFEDHEFDEAAFLVASRDVPFTRSAYEGARMRITYLLGDLAAAELAAKSGAPTLEQVSFLVDHNFYLSLTLTALARQRPSAERGALLDQVRDNQRMLGVWAKNCPANFRHKHLLVEAELARCEDRPIAAVLPLYDEAIAWAAREGFVHEQALANELAGRAHLASGRLTTAARFLHDAIQGFAAWGASAKVASLADEFPDVEAASPLADHSAAADLDLLSVLKAAAAIASEVDLDRLLEKLIHVCAEAAGAERGILVLEEAGQAFVRAAGVVGQPVALGRTRLGESRELPRTIVEHVRAHKLPLTLGEAARDPRFASDPYVERHAVKSVLAVPLVRQAVLIGTLYFENNLVTGAFTPTPVKVLELLTTQVATSLEISQLVETLTREVRERTRAEAELRFLADASSTFAESFDYEATLDRVAHQIVPFLADWCFVDLMDDQHQIRRVASARADRSREILEDIDRDALDWTAPEPWLRVLRTGEPLVIPRITEDILAQFGSDENARRLFRALDAKSWLAIPLIVRGRILGAISLGSRTPEAFGPRELRIAQDLARRGATAIENARLYADARHAIEVRDEFLSVASHELYTPITSMNLAIQGIQSGALPRTPQVLDHVFAVTARQIRRLTRLIDELLNVSRIDAGRLQLELEPVDLAQVAREIVHRFEEDLARSGSSVAIRAEAPVIGRWDSFGLEQVMVNLLGNAIKFGSGKPIEITIERQAEVASLVVKDHGTGIAPDRVPHIFERFERGVTTRQYGGLGLGLYIAKGIVDALGGVVHVESKPGEGSTFTVELPLEGPPTKTSTGPPAEAARRGA